MSGNESEPDGFDGFEFQGHMPTPTAPTGDTNTVDAERLLPDEYDRERLAIGFDYDENAIATIKNADWDILHQDWQPDYEFQSGREGAWVVDCSDIVLEYLETQFPITVPPLSEIPYAADGAIETLPPEPVDRECPECGNDGMLSEDGAVSVHSKNAVWIRPLMDNDRATHVCSSCHTLFRHPPARASSVDDEAGSGGDPSELINTTPEQRARYLERTHDDLREPEARAIAYREAGYSHTGIASQIDKTPGTVSSYLRDIGKKYGLHALETKSPGDRVGPLGGDR